MKAGYVYILTNKPMGVLYIGVTDDLGRRVAEHRPGAVAGFTKRYNCYRLVWFEPFENIHHARAFERQMKKWNRVWKVQRIVEMNPTGTICCCNGERAHDRGGPRLRGDSPEP